MVDHASVFLGRNAPTRAQRKMALPFLQYVKAPLPVAPASCDQVTGSKIGMFGNVSAGNCTIAGVCNSDAIWARIEGRTSLCTETAALAEYYVLTGGVDSGLVEITVLQKGLTGLSLGGPDPLTFAAWTSVPVEDQATRSSLVALFGSLYLGVALPLSAQGEKVWDASGSLSGRDAPGSWGGHCLLEAGYDATNRDLVTWGSEQLCTDPWIQAYCDEAYVLLDAARAEAAGVDWAGLLADMQNVPSI